MKCGPIPAGAGETLVEEIAKELEEAYPRWRGGNPDSPNAKPLESGLSPLARGKL